MNVQKEIKRINDREQRLGIEGKDSWHEDYKDSSFIYVGGLSYRLNEGDLKVAFSQWGTVNHINLIRDKKTGKTRGFAFIGYEDQRSTILAVDNMNGVQIDGRQITVDHKREYKPPKDSDSEEDVNDNEDKKSRKRKRSPKEEEEVDPKKLRKLKKKEKKKQKKHAKREEKRKELMRMAFSQNTSITVEDLEFQRKREKKNSKSINELREEEMSSKKQDNIDSSEKSEKQQNREKERHEKNRSGSDGRENLLSTNTTLKNGKDEDIKSRENTKRHDDNTNRRREDTERR